MIYELYRVLAPGGRYITFSLHSINEVETYFNDEKKFTWQVTLFRLKSSRWNENENRRRAVACTMVVCDKVPANSKFPTPLKLEGVLSDEEYHALESYAAQVFCLTFVALYS